ncbi:hypothetical protein D3C85_1806480 [compost metagenome]
MLDEDMLVYLLTTISDHVLFPFMTHVLFHRIPHVRAFCQLPGLKILVHICIQSEPLLLHKT